MRRRYIHSVLGLLVIGVGAWAAKGLAAPLGWHTADIPVLLVWLGLTAAGGSLLLGLAARVAGESGLLHRLALWVAIPAAMTSIGLHMNAWRKLEADAAQRERSVLPLRVDADSAEEVGYIQQIKRVDHLWENRREIYWFVKIPATNKVYSCSWEGGFAGFARDDAVKLIHKKSDDDADGDYSGFIVGLHGQQPGRSAQVWALDVDDLMRDLDMHDMDER